MWADGGYTGHLVDLARDVLRIALTVVKRSDDVTGFTVLRKRWLVERTFAWLMRSRRLARDYETRTDKWRHQPVTAREVRRGKLADAIQQIFDESGGTYGSPKVWITLVRQGWKVSVNTVAKLMAELGLAGRKIRRRRGLTRPGNRPAFADFVRRDFSATAPDQVWAGDMTDKWRRRWSDERSRTRS
ncbi:IS3 family transposase [Streptomyces sp. NPDC049887]|uniref:IS3 family transposase n=1 Tax=Streptomyces sp. NPDC049887 TaxID=3155654 RepID=UPI0034310883